MIACFQALGSMTKVSDVKASKWWSKARCCVFIGSSSELGLGMILSILSRASLFKRAFGSGDFEEIIRERTHS